LEHGPTQSRIDSVKKEGDSRRYGTVVGKTKSFMGVTYFNKEGQNEYRWNFSTSPKINLINLHK
jgi:hypothetical protein